MKQIKPFLLFLLLILGIGQIQAQTLTVTRPLVTGFTEEFSPENWTFNKPGNFSGSFDIGDVPNAITLFGSDVNRGGSGGESTATLSVEFPNDGQLRFNWSVIHYDYCCDHVRFYILDASDQLIYDSGEFGFGGDQPSFESGTFEYDMLAGYRFFIESSTGDNIFGPIDITLSNWEFAGGTTINQRVRNPVTLGSPRIGAINQPTNLQLNWLPVSGAVAYWLQVSTKPNFNTLVNQQVEGTSFELTGLDNNTYYFWRVRAIMSAEEPFEDWMVPDPWFGVQFSLFKTKLADVVGFLPANGSCVTQAGFTIAWEAVAGASNYQVEISETADFSKIIKNANNIRLNQWELRMLDKGTYYWRVRAEMGSSRNGEMGDWSPTQTFNVIEAVAKSGDASFCEGGSIELSAGSGSNYQWYLNGEIIPGATQSTFKAMADGAYSVKFTSSTACAYTSETITVKVKPLSKPVIQAASTLLCEGQSTVLNIENVYPMEWFLNGESLGGNGQTKLTVNKPGIYTILVRGENGCTITSDALEIKTVPVPTNQKLLVQGATALCSPQSTVLLTAVLSANQTLQWYNANGLISGATSASLSTNEPGAYYAIIRNSAGCSLTTEVINVSDASLPKPEIAGSEKYNYLLSKGYPVALVVQNAPNGVGFRWYFDGELYPEFTGKGVAVLGNVRVEVEIYNQNGCMVKSETFTVQYPAGVKLIDFNVRALTPAEIEIREIDPATLNPRTFTRRFPLPGNSADGAFQTFPNPTNNEVNVGLFVDNVSEQPTLKVYNLYGRLVGNFVMNLDGEFYSTTVSLANQLPGMYIFMVSDRKGIFRKTVKKE